MNALDIFEINRNIVADYSSYVRSFVEVRDPSIAAAVDRELAEGKLWPDALIQFNPAYASGGTVEALAAEGLIHPELLHSLGGWTLHRHQTQALRLAAASRGFVVTSGTGSGKSLAFLVSIISGLLRDSGRKPGIKAVIVYPMNALINSQLKALEEDYRKPYEKETGRPFPISFAKYTGQSKNDSRQDIHGNPPDILLTNYMMLELMLTRGGDADLKRSIYTNLRYLAFDELHTYRGRQGADVAMLIRRIRGRCERDILCMGTSATMASDSPGIDRAEAVAGFASKLFGLPFARDQIIDETVHESLEGGVPSRSEIAASLSDDIAALGEEALRKHPLGRWIEAEVALLRDDSGQLRRGKPATLEAIVQGLCAFTGAASEACGRSAGAFLSAIGHLNVALSERDGSKARLILPYKLHQFVSSSGSVYASLHCGEERQATLDPCREIEIDGQPFPMFELAFSRSTGAEFYSVELDAASSRLLPREFGARWVPVEDDDGTMQRYPDHWGYLVPDLDAWNPERDLAELPDTWVKRAKDGTRRLGPDNLPLVEGDYPALPPGAGILGTRWLVPPSSPLPPRIRWQPRPFATNAARS